MILEVLKRQPFSNKIETVHVAIELKEIWSYGKDEEGYFAEVYTQPCNDIEKLAITKESLIKIMKERALNAECNKKSSSRIH